MKIKVTQAIIDKSTPECLKECVIANALKEALCTDDVSVSYSLSRINGVSYIHSDGIKGIIASYDDLKDVPFGFDIVLDKYEWVIRLDFEDPADESQAGINAVAHEYITGGN